MLDLSVLLGLVRDRILVGTAISGNFAFSRVGFSNLSGFVILV